MNINLIAIAKNPSSIEITGRRLEMSVGYLKSIFGPAEDHVSNRGHVWAYNADRMAKTWLTPTWFSYEDVLYGVSQPPVPSGSDVSPASLPSIVHDRVWGSATPSEFIMNHWGYAVRPDGSVRLWTDLVGFSRVYKIETDDCIAFSNHIGSLAFFSDEPLDIDDEAVGLFANFGWFAGAGTPFEQIKRVDRAKFIDFAPDGSYREAEYLSLEDMTGERDQPANFEAVVEASRTTARNLDSLSVRVPTVYLSGGQDSRMTAGLWLSGGSSANVVTLGTLEKEAEIAQDLISRFATEQELEAQGVVHNVVEPRPSEITMSLPERLSNAHRMWDGDAAPTNMKRNVNIPTGAAALSIGGTNGEITHGYFYSRPGLVDAISKLDHPLKRLTKVYPGLVTTPQVRSLLEPFFDRQYEEIAAAGSPGLACMDVYYLREKLRRWHNQSLSTTSVLLLGSKEYIRMAYDLSVQERIEKLAPKRIAALAVPEWANLPYYKASVAESKVATAKGLRTWLTDTEVFNSVMDNPMIWDRYLSSEKLGQFRDLIARDEALGSHESWFNRAIWIDSIEEHRIYLNEQTKDARSIR